MSRIAKAFATASGEERAAFVPFLTAGFPDSDGFLRHAAELLELADLLEVGLPFSDPLGDGPTIQQASEVALSQGVSTAATFDLVGELRATTDKPLVIMTYYNPIYCYPTGECGFVADVRKAGADGLILPDLPPDEAESLCATAQEVGLDTVFLVAPTSTEARLAKVTAACRGFVYAVSVTGVTGERSELPPEVPDLVRRTRRVTDLPVAVGFGVSNAETAQPVAAVADGVVVGSALIRAIQERDSVRELAIEIVEACRRPTG